MNKKELFNIAKNFQIEGEPIEISKCENGHINKTYEVVYKSKDDSREKYILQNVNSDVFGDIDRLNQNIIKVTKYIRSNVKNSEVDLDRITVRIIKTNEEEEKYIHNQNWRMQKFIENTKTFLSTDDLNILYESGKTIGTFQKYLDGFKVDELYEIIPNFHFTEGRLKDLKSAISNTENMKERKDRFELAQDVIKFALDDIRTKRVNEITDKLDSKLIPYRVTHNDTKLSNILFDIDTNEAVCLIDLDTVMPGAIAYDFGEGLRTTISKSKEDEEDLNKICLDIERFEAFTKGFLQETKSVLTKEELETLPAGLWMMTYENAIRFLADYLNGDTYFNVDEDIKEHNLVRAKAQFELLRQIESKENKMKEVVKKYGL